MLAILVEVVVSREHTYNYKIKLQLVGNAVRM